MSSPELDEEDGDTAGKVHPDPAVSVADLENALEAFFKKVGYRNVEELLEVIKQHKITWKSAPKALSVFQWS